MSEYDDPKNVVDAEIITDASSRNDRSRSYGGQSETYYSYKSSDGSRTQYTYFSMMGPSAPGHQQMSLACGITLGLMLFCFIKWNFLATLGFAFFYIIGSCLGIYFNFRTVLQGRVPNPWITRCCVWGASMLLVSWLV